MLKLAQLLVLIILFMPIYSWCASHGGTYGDYNDLKREYDDLKEENQILVIANNGWKKSCADLISEKNELESAKRKNEEEIPYYRNGTYLGYCLVGGLCSAYVYKNTPLLGGWFRWYCDEIYM